MKLVTTKFKSGGLHEKHVVATWNLGVQTLFKWTESFKRLNYTMNASLGVIRRYTDVIPKFARLYKTGTVQYV